MKKQNKIYLSIGIAVVILTIVIFSNQEGDYRAYNQLNEETINRNVTVTTESGTASNTASNTEQRLNEIFSSLKFGVEDVGYDEFGEDPSAWFENVKKRGVTTVSFDPFDLEEGLTIIDSPALKNMGFKIDESFSEQLKKIFEAAKNNDVYLIIMIESLAHAKSGFLDPATSIKKRKITPDSVGQFIEELGIIAKRNNITIGISEEGFDEEFIPSITESSKKSGITYVHFFEDLDCNADMVLSEDYGYYFKDLKESDEDKEQAKRNLAIGSYYGELGFLNIMYGSASACGKRYGTLTAGGWGFGPKTHQNIALLRSIQFNPKAVFFVIAEDAEGNTLDGESEYVNNYDFSKLKKLIDKFGRKESDTKKPVANLVLDIPDKDADAMDYFDSALLGSVSSITNSMLAAGYDLKVSKKPIEDADIYYVFGSGFIHEKGKDLSEQNLLLKDKNVSVFYQVVGEISSELSPNWDSLLHWFGINEYEAITDETASFEPIPLTTEGEFPSGRFKFKYAGYSLEIEDASKLGSYSEGHTIHYIDPDILQGSKASLTGMTALDGENYKDKTALIIQKGNAYFVNSGYIHFASSSFLTNLMSERPVFNRPNYVYLTSGKERVAVFTAYTEYLDINLPAKDSWEITEFDEKGDIIDSNIEVNNGVVKGTLERFHLLVLTKKVD